MVFQRGDHDSKNLDLKYKYLIKPIFVKCLFVFNLVFRFLFIFIAYKLLKILKNKLYTKKKNEKCVDYYKKL